MGDGWRLVALVSRTSTGTLWRAAGAAGEVVCKLVRGATVQRAAAAHAASARAVTAVQHPHLLTVRGVLERGNDALVAIEAFTGRSPDYPMWPCFVAWPQRRAPRWPPCTNASWHTSTSLALSLWHLAGGRLTDLGSTVSEQVAARVAADLPVLDTDASDLPVEACELLRAATRRRPEQRPTGAEFAEALAAALGGA